MRTTLTIDDRIAKALKEAAHRSGRSFKAVVNETLQTGLTSKRALPNAKRYRLTPTALGGILPGIDIDKALQLADDIEDEEILRKLQMKK